MKRHSNVDRCLDIPTLRDAAQADRYQFFILGPNKDTTEAHAAGRQR